jgi:apolipoprotein N-acyltransferase
VRQTNEGTSMAADYLGNLLAYQDFFATEQRVMLADVPTQGVRTPYGWAGDYVPWLCGLTLLGLALAGVVAGRRHSV